MQNTPNYLSNQLDVVGIGNAIVDVLVKVENNFLTNHGLQKGCMALINETQAEELYLSSISGIEKSGGSAANTLAGLAMLGGKAGFIGRVSNDQPGKIFTNDIQKVGARFETPPTKIGPATARCFVFVTPDAERTMCTYLGASVQLEPEDLDISMVENTKVLYLEGYLWDSPAAKRAFITAAEASKKAGGQIALSLSDTFCVKRHRNSFLELIDQHVDLLFANESEIITLCESKTLNEAITKIQGKCKIIALTCGEKGSVVLEGKHTYKISSYKFGPLIDTTGAGDLYAAGFLYGYTQGRPSFTCGEMGSICSGQVITQLGPRPKASLRNLIETHLD